MKKVFCEVVIKDILGKEHVYKSCGKTQKEAEQKLLKQFPSDKIVRSKVLYEYDEADYGWV